MRMEALKDDVVRRFTTAVTQSDIAMVQVVSLPPTWLVHGLTDTTPWWCGHDTLFLVFSGERREYVAILSPDEIGGVVRSLAKAWLVTRWPRLCSWLSEWTAS